jgi:hypothetical protein
VHPAQFSPSPNSSLKNKSKHHDVTKMSHEDLVQGCTYVNTVMKLQVLLKHTFGKRSPGIKDIRKQVRSRSILDEIVKMQTQKSYLKKELQMKLRIIGQCHWSRLFKKFWRK